MARPAVAITPCILALLAAGWLAAAGWTGIEESVVVRRVHRPVFIEPAGRKLDPTRCSSLGPADSQVTEDGRSVTVTTIDEAASATLHLILLDASASMRTTIDEAKKAALGYLDSLPPGARAAVASFDDNLILDLAPTADRTRLREAILGIEVGNNTALWDALHDVIRYLEPQPGHKVIVLLGDGEDTGSLPRADFERFADLAAAAARNLTIFPIGLALPHRWVRRGFGGARPV